MGNGFHSIFNGFPLDSKMPLWANLPRRLKTLQRRIQGRLRHFKDGPIHFQEPQDTSKTPPTFHFYTKNQKCLFRSRYLSKNKPQDTSKDIPKHSKTSGNVQKRRKTSKQNFKHPIYFKATVACSDPSRHPSHATAAAAAALLTLQLTHPLRNRSIDRWITCSID